MKIDINDKLLKDFKTYITWCSYGKTDSEIIEYLLRNELLKGGYDGYEIDDLSGLLTYSRFRNDLMENIKNILQNKQDQFYKAFIYFNIKNMKEYNDVHSLMEGDKLLSQFSNKLLELYNDYNIYRIGGQEFLLVSFDNIDMKQKIYINDVELQQYYIEVESKNIQYPINKDYLKLIMNKINEINKVRKEKKYKLKL